MFFSVKEVSNDLTFFMDLFDNLSKLFKSPDDGLPAVLDSDCQHSVIGKSWHIIVLT